MPEQLCDDTTHHLPPGTTLIPGETAQCRCGQVEVALPAGSDTLQVRHLGGH